MFYSQFILAKKGPLGTIWIAAHLERKLRKNQVADTDIGVSVDSILFPEMPIALRLSSHLLLGVVRIYSKKVNYLFDDCSEALLKVKQAFRSTAVDLPPEESTAPYHSITLPETFDLDDFELPDSELFQGNYVDHHISSKDQITLQDTMEGVVYSTSNFGLDERFGDDDAGLDLDEELLVEKAAPTANSNVDPQASVEANASIKHEEHQDAPIVPHAIPASGNENQHIEEYDGDNEPVEYAHAPCTPGLCEEPNLSNIQETSACDEHQEPENHIITESAVKENQENAYTKEVPHEQRHNEHEPPEKSPPHIETAEPMQVDDLGSTPFTETLLPDNVKSMSPIPEVSPTVISVAHDVEGSLNENVREEDYVEHQGMSNDIYSGNQESLTSELELNTEPSGKYNLGNTQDEDQGFVQPKDSMVTVQTPHDSMPCVTFQNHQDMSNENAYHPTIGFELNTEPSGKENLEGPKDQAFLQPKDSMITVQTPHDNLPSSGFPTLRPCVTFPNHQGMPNDITLQVQDQAYLQPKDSVITVQSHHDSMPSSDFQSVRPYVTPVNHLGNQENAFHLTSGFELNSEPSGNDNIGPLQDQGFVQPKDSMITFQSPHDNMPSVMLPNHDAMKLIDSHQPSDFSSIHSLQQFRREENPRGPILVQGEVPPHATVPLERNLPETFYGEFGPSHGVQVAPTPTISNRHVENVIEREVQVEKINSYPSTAEVQATSGISNRQVGNEIQREAQVDNINSYTPYFPAPEKQLSLPHWLSDAPKDLPLSRTPAGKAIPLPEFPPIAEFQVTSSIPNRHVEYAIQREAQVENFNSYPPSAEVQVASSIPNRQVEYVIQREAQVENFNSYPSTAEVQATSGISTRQVASSIPNRHDEYAIQREAQVENIIGYPPRAEFQVTSSIPNRQMENVIQSEAQVDHIISYPPRAEVQVTSSMSNRHVENVIQREPQVDNIISYPPPEKQLSLPHWLSDVPKDLPPETTPARQDIAPGYGGNNMYSGRKRNFTETTMTAQTLNLNESSSLYTTSTTTQTLSFNQSSTPLTTNTTRQAVPRDNDMLSSILVGRNTSMLKVKPTPPVQAPAAKRQRRTTPKTGVPKTGVTKRKVLMDDTMVLHGDTIRQQLTNTEDIRRLRKKAPCTHSEISMIQKQSWEDELFGEPIFTGVSIKLASLHRQLYDLSKIVVSHPDASIGGGPEQRSISHNHEQVKQPEVRTENTGVNPNVPKENIARKDVSETQPIETSSVTDNHTYDNNTGNSDYYGSQRMHATRDVNELFGSEHDVLEHGTAMEIDGKSVSDADVGVSVMPLEDESPPHDDVISSDSNDTSAAFGEVEKNSQMDASLEAGPPGFQKMGLHSADVDSNVVSSDANDTSAAVGEVGKTSQVDASLEAGPPGFEKMGLQSGDMDSNVVSSDANDMSAALDEVGKTSQLDASLEAGPPGFQKIGLQSGDMDSNVVSSDTIDTSAAVGEVGKTCQIDASLEMGPPGFSSYEKRGLQSADVDSNVVSSATNDTSAALGEVGKTNQMDASLPSVPPGFGSNEKTGLQSGDMDPKVVTSDANDTSAAVDEVEKTNQTDPSLSLVPPGFGSFQKAGLQSADTDPNIVPSDTNDMSAAVGEAENTSQTDASLPMVPPGFGSYKKPADMEPKVVPSDTTTDTSAAQGEVEKTSQMDVSLQTFPPGFHPSEKLDSQSADMGPPMDISTNKPIETSIPPETELDDASLKETLEEKQELVATTSETDHLRSDTNTLDQDTEIRNNEEEKEAQNLVSNGICDEAFAAENAEVNSALEDALSDKRETPVLLVPFPVTTIDLEDNPSDNMVDDYDNNDDDDYDDNEPMYTGVGNDTDFLNLDDVEDNEAEAADDHMPDGEAAKMLDNSGWSSRTRAVAKYLQIMFDKEGERGRNTLGVNNLLAGKTRKEASRMFFETLVLKTKDYIHVEQTDPFENINVFPRAKLLKSEF